MDLENFKDSVDELNEFKTILGKGIKYNGNDRASLTELYKLITKKNEFFDVKESRI